MKTPPAGLAPRPETLGIVLGSSAHGRTPIHLSNLNGFDHFPEAEVIREDDEVDISNVSDFNAIGSLVADDERWRHLPVLEIRHGGGAKLQSEEDSVPVGDRVLIKHALEARMPRYNSDSFLRDVLARNGISLEVFEYRRESGLDSYTYSDFLELVLRAEEADTFETTAPSAEGEGFRRNLYIQQEFSARDNRALVSELGKLGVVSRSWQQAVTKNGMGIVYTPWAHEELGSPET